MKRKRVRATIEDEAIYAEIEGHVDAELYEIAQRDGDVVAIRVTRVLALEVSGRGGIWVGEDGKGRLDLEQYLRERWLSGEDQPMVFAGEIEDVGEAYAVPSPDQPPLLGVENHE